MRPPIPFKIVPVVSLGCLAMLVTAIAPSILMAQDLSDYRWKNRILQIDTPSTDHALFHAQSAELLAAFEGLLDRDLVVLTRTGAVQFQITLIGKDGGKKLTRRTVLKTDELFAIIDAMPMRLDEMRKSSPSGEN